MLGKKCVENSKIEIKNKNTKESFKKDKIGGNFVLKDIQILLRQLL